MNILILSCGTRNKIIQYFKRELAGRGIVIAADCSELAPALYEADKYYIVPRMSDENYLEHIIGICKENKINAVLTLIDPELSFLAENKKTFVDAGITPIVSDLESVELSFNKFMMYEFLKKNNFKTIRSYINIQDFYRDLESGIINFPVFVKPIKGSASANINKVSTREEIELLFKKYEDLMIQEYMDGVEYGVDAYIDLISNDLKAVFIKEKIKMRAGETDKAISVKNEALLKLIKAFLGKTSFTGVIDIDVFEVKGEYYISEVNPRFGGGYPHAYECGVDFPNMIITNLSGKVNCEKFGVYNSGVIMLKYNEVMII